LLSLCVCGVCLVQYIWLNSANPINANGKKECNNLWLIEFYVYFILVFDQRNNNSEQRVERVGRAVGVFLAQSSGRIHTHTHDCWAKTIIIQLNGCQRMHLISLANRFARKRGKQWRRERLTNSIFHGHTNASDTASCVYVCEVLMRCCDALLLLAVCCFCHLCKKTQNSEKKTEQNTQIFELNKRFHVKGESHLEMRAHGVYAMQFLCATDR